MKKLSWWRNDGISAERQLVMVAEGRQADTITYSNAVRLFDGLTASFGLGPLCQSLASRM